MRTFTTAEIHLGQGSQTLFSIWVPLERNQIKKTVGVLSWFGIIYFKTSKRLVVDSGIRDTTL